MVEELPTHYDPHRVEQHAKEHWSEVNARERANDRDGEPFYFLDGPPFTSGKMHCGTAWGKVLKDALLRYHRMDGRPVLARAGYDTHGLPVEVNVERRHDFETKADVEDYGLDRFVAECREYVDARQAEMDAEFADLGVWMDFEDPYRTMDPDYVETVWTAFSELHDRGLVERGRRVVNTCPRCETAVADARLEYEPRTTTAAYVGFDLVEREGRLVAWTTTPWTVVGNRFVAVDREAEYAAVAVTAEADEGEDENEGSPDVLYVAADRVEATMDALGVTDYAVRATCAGSDLVGREYRHPLADRVNGLPAATGEVVGADYVDVERTGVVHSAPGFGHEDHERGRELGVEPFSPVGLDGRFTEAAGPYAGERVQGAGTDAVLRDLDRAGALLATEPHDHEYPHCPRCDTQVVFRAAEQFLVRVTEMKADLLDALEETTWYPSSARDGRFRNTVEAAPDWNVSRQRFWGTPLPVWVCDDCGTDVVVGSTAELADLADTGASDLAGENGDLDPADLSDPHRPTVDRVTVECPECGGPADRVEDVLDVWFDSAVAPWASRGATPPETPAEWPADLVVEGQDQTRGWFLMQLYLGVALADGAPYEEVLMHGWAMLDGEAMSKSRGHVLRPPDVVEAHGRDALRATLLAGPQQEADLTMRSDMADVAQLRDRLDVVWNVYRFALLYMDADGWDPAVESAVDPEALHPLDRWVRSRLASVLEEAGEAFENREPNRALSSTLDFLVEDVSRYYVKAVRDRVWTPGDTASKRAAYDTLGTVLCACVRLLAPFVPHVAERLYGALDGDRETVHATDWPTPEGLTVDRELERQVALLRDVETAVARARERLGRKRRWPVAAVVVEGDDALRTAVADHADLLADRLNADAVRATAEYEQRRRVLDPDMSALGPAFGDAAPAVADRVEGLPADALPVTVTVEGDTYTVTADHVAVRERVPETVEREPFEGGAVYVDGELTEELRKRGVVRDLSRAAQRLRNDLDLEMDTSVALSVSTDDPFVERALEEYRDRLERRVRVARFEQGPLDATTSTTTTVDGSEVRVGLRALAEQHSAG